MITNKKLATAIAAGALIFNSLATSAFAATTLQISGNGSDSDNTVKLDQTKNSSIVQNNVAKISNNVDVDADTGGNSADDNTGGDVFVRSGDSDVSVKISNMANKNVAELGCCAEGDTSLKVTGNGSDSDNKIDLDLSSNKGIFQDNFADVDNDVDIDSDTGDNSADDNTGGDVQLRSGDSDTSVKIMNALNMNWAQMGGHEDEEGGSLSAWITGNGSDSDNDIYLDITSNSAITQDNVANVDNDVDVDADTGYNSADDNTGGNVQLLSGDVLGEVKVNTAANFNWADMSCGACLFEDLTAKIADNGADSDNKIDADLSSGEKDGVFQDNFADVDNDLEKIDADTGDNSADDNTGDADSDSGDPALQSGDASFDVKADTDVNTNAAGLGDVDFDFDFDLWGLWADLLG